MKCRPFLSALSDSVLYHNINALTYNERRRKTRSNVRHDTDGKYSGRFDICNQKVALAARILLPSGSEQHEVLLVGSI